MRWLVIFVFFSCQTFTSSGPIYKVLVESGDTLASIAKEYDTNWQSIVHLNDLEVPYRIRVGQVLLLTPGPGGRIAKSKRGPEQKREPKSLLFSADPSAKGKLLWPVMGRVTSKFGRRWGRRHQGIDIGAPHGSPIRTVEAGKVVFAGWKRGYGRTVVVDHGSFSTLYAHGSKLKTARGRRVEKGEIIGFVGRSGNARGVHLHFEYRDKNNVAKNPQNFLAERQVLVSR